MGTNMDEYILEKMEDQRDQAFNKISMIFPDASYIDEFATSLTYAFFEEISSAVKIAENAGLDLLDFCAIDGDIEYFSKLFMQNENRRIGEEMYDNCQRY
jgi:hypothetical protein